MTLSHLRIKKFKVTHERELRGEVLAKVGDTVYDYISHDYGLASDDTRFTGIEHTSVTSNADGSGPSFTIPVHHLREIKEPIELREIKEPIEPVRLVDTSDKRLALLTARTIFLHEGEGSDYDITAMEFGATKFEGEYIELAAHWWNDMLDLCMTELGIKEPEDLSRSNSEQVEAWNNWLQKELDKWPSLIKLG